MEKHGSASTRKLAPHTLVNPNNLTTQDEANRPHSVDKSSRRSVDNSNSHSSGNRSLHTLDNNRKSSVTLYGTTTPREYDLLNVPRSSDVIDASLKRRARRLAVDGRVAHATRRMIRYALDNRDPYLIQLVTRVEAGEMRIEHLILEDD